MAAASFEDEVMHRGARRLAPLGRREATAETAREEPAAALRSPKTAP